MLAKTPPLTLKDTADIRDKLLRVWKLVDENKISATEARLHISIARAILDTLKVEIAAAHLTQSQLPSVTISKFGPVSIRQQ